MSRRGFPGRPGAGRWVDGSFLGWSTSPGQLPGVVAAAGHGRGSVTSPASGRSIFPTRLPKNGNPKQFHPTISARIRPNCVSRWGVLEASGANACKSSIYAGFSARQSLHMRPYRKVCRPAGYVVTDASGILLAQDGGMISPGNATPLTVCIYERKVRCQPLLQIAFDSIGGSVLSFPRRTTAPRQTQPEGRWLHLVFVARVAGFTSDD